MSTLGDFTRQYSLSKTLRFELKPIGRTKELMSRLLEEDIQRASDFLEVKKIIDRYHKHIIEDVLAECELCKNEEGENEEGESKDLLKEYYNAYKENSRKDLGKYQKELRKVIAGRFKDATDKENGKYKNLFEAKLIKEILPNFVEDEREKDLIKKFELFTTYFKAFHDNRKNMHSDEPKHTSIAYRLIHENLPRFIDNMSVFEEAKQSLDIQSLTDLSECFKLELKEIDSMFKLDYFNKLLTQKQIDKYNAIIGGVVLDDGTKVKGFNEYINLYNQRQEKKSDRLPKLKPLYKQILSDRNAISWLPEKFSSDNELLEAVQKTYQELDEQVFNRKNGKEHSLKDLLQVLEDYDLDKIYIVNDTQIKSISKKLYDRWDYISNALLDDLKSQYPKKKNEKEEQYAERLNKAKKSFSIGEINRILQNLNSELLPTVQSYFVSLGDTSAGNNIFTQISDAYANVKDLLNIQYPEDKKLIQDKENIEKVKNLLDAIKNLQHFVKPLLGDGTEPNKDERFYGEFVALWEKLNDITLLYDKVRNYVTRKPYSTEKIKLNFGNSTLMNGWDVNKEKDNLAVILRKDGLYYLAIMNKDHNKVFDVNNLQKDGECYEKMEYKLIANPQLDIQNIIRVNGEYERFTKGLEKLKSEYIPEIYAIREKKSYLKGNPNYSRDDLNTFIDYYKEAACHYWNRFDLNFKQTEDYQSFEELTNDCKNQGYSVSFRKVSVNYVNSLVNEGKIYLFQIYNKDFSPYSKGTPNLHTLYWKMLFEQKNLSDVVYKLNGEAEVYYRKSSLTCDRPTHPANQSIDNKNELNSKRESKFDYDLVKDKRYTEDKYQFHVPITINFKCLNNKAVKDEFNERVREHIKDSDNLHIIGIDRGERNLLYLTVIDLEGRIKEQYSLNKIDNTYEGNVYSTDYHGLLSKREKERMSARLSWQEIDNIKELKEGYLSQVIHKISELMIKYNAIVVLEDLNAGFKRGRQKVDASVYQKFEKMLVDKLNYLVDKKKAPEIEGGLLNAYQFTNIFDEKDRKQNGFLFYVPAWNTSKIDPVTGFVNLLDTRYESVKKAQDFFGQFDSICYNHTKGWFEFEFDYSRFLTKAVGPKTHWTVCSYGKRIETARDENQLWTNKEIDLTERFKSFFDDYGLDICADLKEQILHQDSKDFFEKLLNLLKLTLQIRNSKTGTEIDYLQSPVADENGQFYNSDDCGDDLPKDADANGAYNIARKGLWFVRQIKNKQITSEEGFSELKLTNNEWLKFAQEKPYSD